MKISKKILALFLAVALMASGVPGAFAAETKAAEVPVTSTAPAQLSLEQQVLNAYAEAMFLRGERVQYDASSMVPAEPVHEYRFQIKTMANEDYTTQYSGNTNCAAFVHDIYWFALGMDIRHFKTADLIKSDEKTRVFYYKPTGKETAEEKEAMKTQFLSTLQPGDLVVYRSKVDTGHALYYVGNDRIIHSSSNTTGSYDYNAKLELHEPKGSIMEMRATRFFEEDYSRNLFTYASQIAIVRPLNVWDGTVPQTSIDRVNNLKGIVGEKLCSKTVGQFVLPGEELTYTLRLENRNEAAVTLEVRNELNAYTSLVSGCDNVKDGVMSWTMNVPAGQTVDVVYTVRVDENAPMGQIIEADKTTVGGVPFKCPGVYVGKHLTAEQKAALTKAAQTAGDKTGVALAKAVYADTGVSLDTMEDVAVLMDSALIPSEKVGDHFQINDKSPYFAALAPTMYGGTLVETGACFAGARTFNLRLDQLEVGDIVIASYAPFTQEYVMYLVAGEDSVLRLDQPQLLTGEDAVKALDTAIAYHKFLVVRPAALPEKEAVADLTASDAAIIPQVAELTGEGETVTLFSSDFESYTVGEDAMWQSLLAGEGFATNVTEKDAATVRYDIVEEDGNKALQLFSAKKKTPWVKVNEELVGNYTVQLDFKLSNEPKLHQYLYMTLYQDSKTHAFVHLHTDGVRFQYKPLPTDQTSTALNVPTYMFYPEHSTPDVWHTIKIARVNDGLYVKVWDKGQPEPEEWMLSLRNDVLDASQPSYFRMQYYVSNVSSSTKIADIKSTMLVDNLTITRQVDIDKGETADEVYTRGQMMSDLWQMMGSPKVKNVANPFVDVKENDEYCDAVLWAYANGITAGTSATTFSPDTPVKRGQAVTFLYRAAKAAASAAGNPYADVSENDYFCAPVLWAAENGVMEGVENGKFAPAEDCTRNQIVDALYRMTDHAAAEKNEDAPKDSKLSILMVGNSFCYYYTEELYALLMENLPEGIEEVEIYNLYYSGCTLTKHLDWWQNNADGVYRLLKVDAKGYENLEPKEKWTLEQALAMADWDYISLQGTVKDGSYMNVDKRETTRDGIAATAEPLLDHFHKLYPEAQLLWNRTWYFEVGRETSTHVYTAEEGVRYNDGMQEICDYMCNEFDKEKPYDLIQVNAGEAWTKARELNETASVLPYGGLCARNKVDKFGDKRPNSGDGQHDGDIGGGQLLNAYRWYMTITGDTDLSDSAYVPVYNGVPLDTKLVELLKQAAMEIPV